MKRLAGRRSPRWAFMERFEIPNIDNPSETYLTRWRLIQTPRFGIYLHRMDGPDSRPTLHNHPWNFRSLIIYETVLDKERQALQLSGDLLAGMRDRNRAELFAGTSKGDTYEPVRPLTIPNWMTRST